MKDAGPASEGQNEEDKNSKHRAARSARPQRRAIVACCGGTPRRISLHRKCDSCRGRNLLRAHLASHIVLRGHGAYYLNLMIEAAQACHQEGTRARRALNDV